MRNSDDPSSLLVAMRPVFKNRELVDTVEIKIVVRIRSKSRVENIERFKSAKLEW